MKKILQRLADWTHDVSNMRHLSLLLAMGFSDEARMERDIFLK